MARISVDDGFCKGCGLCKFIIVTDDKGIKNIFGIKMSFFAAGVLRLRFGRNCLSFRNIFR